MAEARGTNGDVNGMAIGNNGVDATHMYQCLQDTEQAVASGDPTAMRHAVRRAALHLLRIESTLNTVVELHKTDSGNFVDIHKYLAMVRQSHAALFGNAAAADPLDQVGLVSLVRKIEDGRRLMCRMFYALLASIAALGALISWGLDLGNKLYQTHRHIAPYEQPQHQGGQPQPQQFSPTMQQQRQQQEVPSYERDKVR